MRRSSRKDESHTRQQEKSVWGNLMILVGFIRWLVDFTQLTEAERNEAGIYAEHQKWE